MRWKSTSITVVVKHWPDQRYLDYHPQQIRSRAEALETEIPTTRNPAQDLHHPLPNEHQQCIRLSFFPIERYLDFILHT
jgi:hypothetical protein